MKKIVVKVDQPYEVTVGRNLLDDLSKSIPSKVNKIAIIFAPIMKETAKVIEEKIRRQNDAITVTFIPAPDCEAAKTFEFFQTALELLGQNKFTRSDAILSLGGGATTDVAGFIAASWLRGIDVIHVPTTLLAMVDAAVGGKTGLNTSAGKNLVGAFHHPTSVWCDLDFLKTLPYHDIRAGFAEVIKCGFIAEKRIIDLALNNGKEVLNPESPFLSEAIELAISVKARVVAADFKENATNGIGREILNYGHTLGHAIENIENYTWRHGDAISVGMMFAANLAVKTGLADESLRKEQQEVFDLLGLPTTYSGDFNKILEVMSIDKKARGATLRFIGLVNFGNASVIVSPTEEDLKWSFEKLQAG